jgi:flavin-dependent dehydrogenase
MERDCVVVGASFAGLACAMALAGEGVRVTVLEKKSDAGEKLHTTGIIVKDAIDQIAILDRLPAGIVRRIAAVRLYAPNLRHVDLAAPGYYFLSTDTPELMRWLAGCAQEVGADIRYGALFRQAERTQSGFDLGEHGTTRFLVGADGPKSTVAKALGLGQSRHFLFGLEHEYCGVELMQPDMLHCFLDRRLAPGYIGWIVAAPNGMQVGLARRAAPRGLTAVQAMGEFLAKIALVADLRTTRPASVRAGMIPCGGVVRPVAARRVLLTGDAAGMVSPVTAGGIHNALKHGLAAGHAIADYLRGRCDDPSGWFVDSYPTFRIKRLLRFAFDRFQSDLLFDLLLHTRAVRTAASIVYFHHKGLFDPDAPGSSERRTRDARASDAT